MSVSHEDRVIAGIQWDGFRLALNIRAASAGAAESLLVLNPVGAQRRMNPANVGAFDAGGELRWVLPLDRSRLTLAAHQDPGAKALFDGFWTMVRSAAIGTGQIWEPGHPVGNRGVELGAKGNRPTGHPWLTLIVLQSGLHLVCAISAREGQRERSYQAWFDRDCLMDASGHPLTWKVGVLNPDDGAVEIAHFAAVNPNAEGWTPLARLALGSAASLGLAHVAEKFAMGWPQSEQGRVLYACTSAQSVMAQCDECAGR